VAETGAANDNHNICQLFRDIVSRMERNVGGKGNHLKQQTKSAAILTSEFCSAYLSIPEERISYSENHPKQQFFELLVHDQYYVDKDAIASAMGIIHPHTLRDGDVQRIRKLCTPLYETIFHYILGSAKKDLGVAFLVHLRRDIRDFIQFSKFNQEKAEQIDDEEGRLHTQVTKLTTMDRTIQSILTTLFRPGALNLRRITYEETPAFIIEQVAFKEAVHPFTSLLDLRTRLGPGRRCFAYFHPALPNKPLAFIHVTLLNEMPRSMIDVKSASEDNEPRVAAFYSITNTEKGLVGVDLGNHLIKSVVQAIQTEFPSVETYCTLSPIPKFRQWLETKVTRNRKQFDNKHDDADHPTSAPQAFLDGIILAQSELHLLDLLETLDVPARRTSAPGGLSFDDDDGSSALFEQLRPLLLKLAAYYLTIEKHHHRPICSVAKFHSRNGAEVFRLNFMADLSQRGMRNSYGIMVNYRYVLDEIEENSVRHEIYGDIVAKDEVICWLDGGSKDK
jgi:malonyl-CoA decarboxylase